ncbi:TPA: hypothetical protein ACP6IR_002617 [Clostridioides difficile]|uniref:hypothetical protein n=1 Tax=Clostridioides difficile TaxID=1496 RepID=UPI00097FDA5E|nr:hypothetical protein [Clostridioides difficile]EKJ1397760.1 hypothetical protein [Clostridioides difficile]MCI9995070.1 hypothetical protein [Clostridioides difficile]SJT86064.1 Uncharacterised protein [Clostridioides difficile]HBF5454495.1 hypothetical protein [Clostridioides difficile]HBF6274217.1 hypothetical protein [Clostridioides difficile]
MRKFKKWQVILGVVLVMGIIGSFLPDPPEEEPTEASNQQEQPEEEKPVDVSNLELSDEKYLSEIKNVDNSSIRDVKIDGSNVIVTLEDLGAWGEKSLVKDTATIGVDIFRKAFENKNAQKVTLQTVTLLTDEYGKESEDKTVVIIWNRETSDKVDYDNFKDLVYSDFTKLYGISDSYAIHPGIFAKLDNKTKATLQR